MYAICVCSFDACASSGEDVWNQAASLHKDCIVLHGINCTGLFMLLFIFIHLLLFSNYFYLKSFWFLVQNSPLPSPGLHGSPGRYAAPLSINRPQARAADVPPSQLAQANTSMSLHNKPFVSPIQRVAASQPRVVRCQTGLVHYLSSVGMTPWIAGELIEVM